MVNERACVYCLCPETPEARLTVDHVIARSWYPSNTPAVRKWTAPACQKCNNRLSRDEQETLISLAHCLPPYDPAYRDIVERARRAIDPRAAKSANDAARRFNARMSLRRRVVPLNNPYAEGVLPAFRENFSQGSRTGILVPARALEAVAEKWIRGVHYCEIGRPIPANYRVSSFFVENDVAARAYAQIMKHASHVQKGPGIEVFHWHVIEHGEFMATYAFNIWGRFRVHGAVEKAVLDKAG